MEKLFTVKIFVCHKWQQIRVRKKHEPFFTFFYQFCEHIVYIKFGKKNIIIYQFQFCNSEQYKGNETLVLTPGK